MKLGALKLTDLSDNTLKSVIEISELNHSYATTEVGDRPFMIAGDDLPNDYTEINEPKHWHLERKMLNRDYKWVRDKLKPHGQVEDVVWDMYDQETKEIIASYKACSELRVKSVYDDAERRMSDYNEASIQCRKHRWSLMKAWILTNVDEADRLTVLGTLDVIKQAGTDLQDHFIEHGIAGINYGDTTPGILNWVVGDNGFGASDAVPGFAHITVKTINGYNQADIIENVIKIGHDGEYEYKW